MWTGAALLFLNTHTRFSQVSRGGRCEYMVKPLTFVPAFVDTKMLVSAMGGAEFFKSI